MIINPNAMAGFNNGPDFITRLPLNGLVTGTVPSGGVVGGEVPSGYTTSFNAVNAADAMLISV